MSRQNPNFRLSCPSPYKLDPSVGLCVEPAPQGFTYVNGKFLRNCPDGMKMNDLGVCIRPVMGRTSFVNENSIQQTTLAIGGQKTDGGSSVIFGSYDQAAYDMTFVNSVGLSGGVVQQVMLSDGSQGLFIVAQDRRSGQTSSTSTNPNTQNFDAITMVTQTGSAASNASANSADQIPDASVIKMAYTSNDNGQVYMLGNPRSKIFLANYSSSLYSGLNPKGPAPKNTLFEFQKEAYSVSGTTDPYYVGSYEYLDLNSNGDLVTVSTGALQNGLDADTMTNPPVSTPLGSTGASGSCNPEIYVPTRPADPVAQMLSVVSDAASRNFTTDALSLSNGFVISGKSLDIVDSARLGGAIAVRYIDDDPCTLNSPPNRPTIQALTAIDLSLNENNGDIRVGRFDVEQAGAPGQSDTFYVFGSDPSDGSRNDGPVLSFITENTVYFAENFLTFTVAVTSSTSTGTPTNCSLSVQSLNAFQVFTLLASIITDTITAVNTVPFNVVADLSTFTTSNRLRLTLVGDTPNVSIAIVANAALATLLGLGSTPSFTLDNTNVGTSNVYTASNAPDVSAVTSVAAYNGLSWDDQSAIGSLSNARQRATAMPVGTFSGQGLQAWSYDAVSQSLGFAIGNNEAQNFGSYISKTTTTFETTDALRRYAVPSDCIDLEIHMWGAGGSSDPNAKGTGGAGAYIGGHLSRSFWRPGETTFNIVVGAGGSVDSGSKITEGQGGTGSRNNVGRGGGRSAIQLGQRDILTAGGGGGSIGIGQGGAATATAKQAENGLPDANGGRGATPVMAGSGGIIFGDTRYKKTNDGRAFSGASSGWNVSSTAIGGGGGGSGFYGGGAAGYLGTTGSPFDLPSGGGGGSSYSANFVSAVTISGERSTAPYTSNTQYIDGVAEGGSQANGGLGGPGLVVIIATRASGFGGAGPNWTDPTPQSMGPSIWASPPNAFRVLPQVALGAVAPGSPAQVTPANWSSIFTELTLPQDDPAYGPVRAMYVGLGGLVVVVTDSTDGLIVGPTADNPTYTNVWWTILGTGSTQALTRSGTLDAFGPISASGHTVLPISNVRSIRALEPINGSRDIIFIGDGIRIVTAPTKVTGTWSNPRYIVDNDTLEPLDSSVSFTDAQFNENTSSVEATGRLSQFSISMMHKTPWAPVFASFYDAVDITTEVTPFNPWYTSSTWTPFESSVPIYSNHGLGPVITASNPFITPLPNWTTWDTYNNAPMPNSIFCIRLQDSNSGPTSWVSLNIYSTNAPDSNVTVPQIGPDSTSGTTTPLSLRLGLQSALQMYVDWICTLRPSLITDIGPIVSVVLAPFNIIDITITGLGEPQVFEMAFASSTVPALPVGLFASVPAQTIDDALGAAGRLLGFGPNTVASTTISVETPIQTYSASFTAINSIENVPGASGSSSKALTPLSVAIDVNSAYAGSLYHTYAPQVKFATVQPNTNDPLGVVVAIGGPIADPIETMVNQPPDDSQPSLWQPIPGPGSNYFIDFVYSTIGSQNSYSWQILSGDNGDPITIQNRSVLSASPIRPPANILSSSDGGASYGYAESLLGSYLSKQNTSTGTAAYVASNFAMTALDSFHISNLGGVRAGVGPARFRTMTGSDGSQGQINAAVSQFNDVIFIDVPVSVSTPQGQTTKNGYFVAVGQFLWELNAVLADTSLVKWPSTWHNLPNVCWVSIDGITWTTLPIIKADFTTAGPANTPELFWMVYKIDYVDPINFIGTILTDVGLYKFDARQLSGIIGGLFGTQSKPVLDFTLESTQQAMIVNSIGRTGQYAAVCTSRDPTGTCIKCLGDNSRPVSIPQIVGPGGIIQPNFDTCIRRPEAAGPPQGYTSVEAGLDAWAIAAYAGYDTSEPGKVTKNSSYVNSLRQSYFAENILGNSLIVCPRHTDASTTPSNVNGRDSALSNDMLCSIDEAMQKPLPSSSAGSNTTGIVIVRRPAKTVDSVKGLDDKYDGTFWQNEYAYEVRHLIMTPYDTFGSTTALPAFLPDSCPSTLGLGGSTVTGPNVGLSDVYPNGLQRLTGPEDVSTAILAKITNKGAFDGPDGNPLDGPFTENSSLFSESGANYNPNVDYDRAVLANDDTLDQFAYSQYAGGDNGVLYSFDGQKQVQNDNLYRLSSYEYPFDGQATSGTSTEITIGRDPQVYEPGFGPLRNYLTGSSTGFAVSKYNTAQQPWPTNPLPQEGFGHWWIRPVLNANGSASSNAVFQSALGYGTLTFTQSIDSAHAYATGAPGRATNTFMYDTTSNQLALNYMQGPWTSFLPFNGYTGGITTNVKSSAVNAVRNNRAMYAIQNLLALRLLNKSQQVYSQQSNNFAVLVSCNFYRPRNWAFTGLALDNTGLPLASTIGNGVSVQVLTSDQPNAKGQYEFLIPDPFYAAVPIGRLPNGTIAGIQSQVWTYGPNQNPVQGPEYNLMTTLLNGLSGSIPSSLTVLEGTVGGTLNWPKQHNAWHYWTYGSTSTLDVYVNVSGILGAFLGGSSITFDWLQDSVLPETKWSKGSLTNVLTEFASNKSTAVQNAVKSIIAFDDCPVNYIVWTDAGAQTTRSLKSMMEQGLNVVLSDSQAVLMVGLSQSGLAKRASGRPTVATDYTSDRYSLLRYTYSVNVTQVGTPLYKNFFNSNQNSTSVFGTDSAVNGQNAGFGHVPPADVRGYSSATNFVPPSQAVNVYSSDYDIERDNSAVFAEIQRPASMQDLLAQNYDGLGFGDPVWGFGHRLDSNVLVPEIRGPQAPILSTTTNGTLPTDHGYVSMVRTTVDSHERYQRSTTPTLEKYPHAVRLTYVTKYVPSNLKNYGAIVQLQPMRPMLASSALNAQTGMLIGVRQNLVNPFKPLNSFLIENVPTVQWYRPTATGRNYGGTPNTLPGLTQTSPFSATEIMWRACRSDYFDVEAPGYYGRQKLTLAKVYDVPGDSLTTTENDFFDSSAMPKAKIFQIAADTTTEQPIAGYQEVLDGTSVFIGSSTANALSFRSLGPTVVESITNSVSNSTAYYANFQTSNVIFGQMLLNMLDAFDPTVSTVGTQTDKRAILHIGLNDSLGVDHQTITTAFYSSNISIQQFMYTYMKPAYATVFGYSMPTSSAVLVTHAEFSSIAALGIQAWINATISSSGSVVTVTSVFDVFTDRPDFKFSINGSHYFRTFRMYLAPPVSNWLGLNPVVPPMFDMSAVRFSQSLYIQLFYSSGYNGQDNGSSSWDWYPYVGNYYENQGALNTAWMSIYDFALMVKDVSYQSFPVLGSCTIVNALSLPKGATLSRFYYHGEENTFRFYVRNQCEVIMRAFMQVTNDVDRTKPSLSIWSGLTAANSTNYPFLGVSADDFQHAVSQPANVPNSTAPIILWDISSGLWYTVNGGTRGASENAWTTSGWAAVSGVWAPLPQYATAGQPMYSLYFDTSGDFNADFALYQDIHFGGSQNTLESFSMMCDISNVSWSTRLNSSVNSYQGGKCEHYWGVVSNDSTRIDASNISVYQADAHVKVVTLSGDGPVFSQNALNSTNYSPNFMGASGFTKTPFTNGSTMPTSSCPFLDCAAVAAIQVPCSYGGNGSYNSNANGKPALYDSTVNFDTLSMSGAPSPGTVAGFSLTSASRLNWLNATRDCYSAISSVSPTASGNFTNPFQLQLLANSASGVSLVPSVPVNEWSVSGIPVAIDALNPGVGPSGKSTLTNACSTTVFMVSTPCYVNVGPTPMSIADVASTTRMALYAFNYSDLFGSDVQPWTNGLRNGTVDFSHAMKSYLQAVPYFMDEGYDGSQYSSLGRSFLIGTSNSQLSSATNLPLNFNSGPVLIVFAPATGSPSIVGGKQLTGDSDIMLSTYSNSMVYDFTEPYSQNGESRAVYSIAFTDPVQGPAWTFYGLDNNAQVTGNAAGSTQVKCQKTDDRKLYVDFGSIGKQPASMLTEQYDSNTVLGLDVRQVYTPVSAGINAESAADPYENGANFNQFAPNSLGFLTNAPWPLAQPPTFTMTYVTYESPNWPTAKTIAAPFLPLAGTWKGDLSTGVDALPQSVPNYEGLSLVSEWSDPVNGIPQFVQWAVDRVQGNIGQQGRTDENPFSAAGLEAYRPQTLFTLLCDVWRNTIREVVPLKGPNGLTGAWNPSSANNDAASIYKTIPIDFVDCMGPGEYDATIQITSQYFGMCNGTLNGTFSQPAGLQTDAVSIQTTPWTVGSQVWSPFTGGSFWNSFIVGGPKTTQTDPNRFLFPPNIWWPTYKWILGETDPNNVWPTGVTSNANLLESNFFVFGCTDGTIRKVFVPGGLTGPGTATSSQPYPVVESTNFETFYNDGVNQSGDQKVFSYSWPGRLFNLTWWANNWWATADNSAVWTTAPLNDTQQTPINDQIVVNQFVCDIIKFRPLSVSEGHPPNWINAQWPTNEAHKYNCMRIIQYQGSSALFVGSVDGEYLIITAQASRFQSLTPNGDPQAFGFLPTSDFVQPLTETSLYVTDICVIGQNLVVGSIPLPLDPQVESSVPWFGGTTTASSQKPLPLPLHSLSYASSAKSPIASFLSSQDWPKLLTDSNVLTVLSIVPYDSAATIDLTLQALSAQLQDDLIGQNAVASIYQTGYTSGSPATGLRRLVRPSATAGTTLQQRPNDKSYPFYAESSPDNSLDATNVVAGYGLYAEQVNAYNFGNTILALQHNSNIQYQAYSSKTNASVVVPLFYGGGLDFDRLTKAFFVIDTEFTAVGVDNNYGSGLKKFLSTTSTLLAPAYTFGNLYDSADYNIVAVQSGSNTEYGVSPMYINSMSYSIGLSSLQNGAYGGVIDKPQYGPLQEYQSQINNYESLNLFQNMHIRRSAPIIANLVISDLAYAKEAEAMAFTTYGPYGAESPTIANIIADGSLQTIDKDPDFSGIEARLIGPSIMGWSPYELKWYVAGVITNMPDWETVEGDQLASLRPSGIPLANWPQSDTDTTRTISDPTYVPKSGTDSRFAILSADASSGTTISDYSINFTQVYSVLSKTPKGQAVIRPLGSQIYGASCFGFSPNISAIGCSVLASIKTWPTGVIGTGAAIAWRSSIVPAGNDLKANWSILNLAVPGTVTALKYVGYAWYIATWDPYANYDQVTQQYEGQSTLFFASINFNAVSPLDSWSSNQIFEVRSIDAATPKSSTCAAGFEPDPNNPNVCVKICPNGFAPFGQLCVQKCVQPYVETGVPNECQSDSLMPRFVSPTASGAPPVTIINEKMSGPSTQVQGERQFDFMPIIIFGIIYAALMLLVIGIRANWRR